MKIELSKRVSVEFQDLMNGDVFTCDNVYYYIKTQAVENLTGDLLCNCVRITDGEVGITRDETKVFPIEDAVVNIHEC